MRHWIRRCLDWAMSDLFSFGRHRPTEQAVHTRYEKAGLTLYGPPVPWNADAVVVEVLARLPPVARQRADFILRLPGREPVPADAVRADDLEGARHRVYFRLPVPSETVVAEVMWKHRLLATVPITVLQADQFLNGLQVANPTVAVRIGSQAVAAQTFVAAQCRGLTAAAVLRSPTGLAPLADLGVKVLFRSDRGGFEIVVPVPLTGSQLAAKEALVTAAPTKAPRRAGEYSIIWTVGGWMRLTQRVTAVAGRRFIDSLRVSDARFVAADKAGTVKVLRQPPPAGEAIRVGPCFLLASREPGAAGLLTLQVAAVGSGSQQTPLLLEQQVLVTDGPTVFAPGLLDVADLAGLTGFELRHRGRVLGMLSVSPVPAASFNAEGAFKPPPDFAWSHTAEDELAERLGKLMGGGPT
jgi:hypothetical protein